MNPETVLKKKGLRWLFLKRLYEFEQAASRKGVAPVLLFRLNDLTGLAECNETDKTISLYWYRKGYISGEAEFKVVGYQREDIDRFIRVWLTQKGLEYVEDRIIGELEKESLVEKLIPSTLTLPQVSALGHRMGNKFIDDELRDLARRLSIDYENLPGDNKLRKAHELVEYCVRYEKLPELWNMLHEERPRYDWAEILI